MINNLNITCLDLNQNKYTAYDNLKQFLYHNNNCFIIRSNFIMKGKDNGNISMFFQEKHYILELKIRPTMCNMTIKLSILFIKLYNYKTSSNKINELLSVTRRKLIAHNVVNLNYRTRPCGIVNKQTE